MFLDWDLIYPNNNTLENNEAPKKEIPKKNKIEYCHEDTKENDLHLEKWTIYISRAES